MELSPDTILVFTKEHLIIALVVSALLQTLKRVPWGERIKPYMAWLSITLAIGCAFLWRLVDPVQAGILVGLFAAGGYDIFKLPSKPT